MIRGDVYLIKFREPDKKRPALILTRTGAIKHLNAITVIPITTTIRDVRSQVILDEADGMEKLCVINVDNIQTISREKVGSYVTHLAEERMDEVFDAIKFAIVVRKMDDVGSRILRAMALKEIDHSSPLASTS